MAENSVVIRVSERGLYREGHYHQPGSLVEVPPWAVENIVEASPPFGEIVEGTDTAADAPGDVDASDAARELAMAHQVDLRSVEGSGEDGRVLKRDVQEAISEREG